MSVYIVTASQVRDYLELNDPNTTSSRYSDARIGSNILAAQEWLEHECGRYFTERTAVSWTIPGATMLRAQVPIPGFRTFTACQWGGSTITVSTVLGSGSAWAIPDVLNTGVYVALQFRAWRADSDRPWFLADSNWWDKLLDNPFYPGNWGGGYAWTSMPDDLVITGDAGYVNGQEPYALRQAVLVLASFYTMRPQSILADVAITPAGGVLTYSQMPAEVRSFVADWKIGGEQVVSM